MKLTKRGEYALRALIDLALAREAGRTLVALKEIAARETIPLPFLEQIFVQLREAGIVDGKRGKGGGFFLAKVPEQIPIGEVVRLIDGPLAPICCVSLTAYAKCSCPDEEHCGLRLLMLDVRNAIANILDKINLAQAAKASIDKLLESGLPMPFSKDEVQAKAALDFQI
ncbi:MAG: Rrf2 family transcriptional regulator [Verrucomicrobia bacterium]|nr:Rrf2 family transcriptional regulator [Verrucomicrobiota bacterium]